MIVAVVNHKGGVGKTTTALTLAHTAALAGRPVAVLDLDAPAGGKAAGASQAFYRAQQLGIPAWTVDNVPAPLPPDLLLVIDTPPDIAAPQTAEAVGIADVVLVPTGVSPDELEVTEGALAELASLLSRERAARGRQWHEGGRVLVVLTRVPHYAQRRADEAEAWLLENTAPRVARARIPASHAFVEAADARQTVAAGRRTSWRRAAEPYAELLAEIEGGRQ